MITIAILFPAKSDEQSILIVVLAEVEVGPRDDPTVEAGRRALHLLVSSMNTAISSMSTAVLSMCAADERCTCHA